MDTSRLNVLRCVGTALLAVAVCGGATMPSRGAAPPASPIRIEKVWARPGAAAPAGAHGSGTTMGPGTSAIYMVIHNTGPDGDRLMRADADVATAVELHETRMEGGMSRMHMVPAIAVPPRGQVDGLVTVTAAGSPPTPGNLDLTQTIGARPFLTPELSAAIAALAPQVPEGAALVYDPRYGLGWSDPRGWQAYFGKNNSDIAVKLAVYQSMVDHLAERGIQPTLVSVEYPNSPFYRVSESD